MTNRIGRRGAYLLFLALLDFLFGYSLLIAPNPALAGINLIFPVAWWGFAWLFVGAICLWQAFVRLDRLAFSLAVTIKILWGFTGLYAWIVSSNDPRGWVTATIFIAFGLLTSIVSFWPEHVRTFGERAMSDRDGEG